MSKLQVFLYLMSCFGGVILSQIFLRNFKFFADAKLLKCPACLGFWIGCIGVIAFWWEDVPHPFAVAAVCYLLGRTFGDDGIRVDWQRPNVSQPIITKIAEPIEGRQQIQRIAYDRIMFGDVKFGAWFRLPGDSLPVATTKQYVKVDDETAKKIDGTTFKISHLEPVVRLRDYTLSGGGN